MDLQGDPGFRDLDVELLNIAVDAPEAWRSDGSSLGITTPMLSDAGNQVATAYGVMQWKMPTNEPGHTFVLIDAEGRIAWIRDYGALENGGLMYVPVVDLVPQIIEHLEAA